MRIKRRRFDQGADAPQKPSSSPRKRGVKKSDLSRIRAHQPEQHPDGRRLSRAVRPQKAIDASARNRQIHGVDLQSLFKTARQAARFYDIGLHSPWSPQRGERNNRQGINRLYGFFSENYRLTAAE